MLTGDEAAAAPQLQQGRDDDLARMDVTTRSAEQQQTQTHTDGGLADAAQHSWASASSLSADADLEALRTGVEALERASAAAAAAAVPTTTTTGSGSSSSNITQLAAQLPPGQQQAADTAAALRLRVMAKLEALREQASQLEGLAAERAHLHAQVTECERLAAANSELRQLLHSMPALQEEADTLRPQAQAVQELRDMVAELRADAAALPAVQVREKKKLVKCVVSGFGWCFFLCTAAAACSERV